MGRVSPRIFKQIPEVPDLSGGYFRDFVNNNFGEMRQKMFFLIKFYQCLLAGQLRIKVPKLTLVGDRNSGKTSLVNVLLGLTQPEFVATLSREKVFGTSMISNDTQLIFIDELCAEILPADQAKLLLQGGMLTVPKKHGKPEVVDNTAGSFCWIDISVSLFHRFNANHDFQAFHFLLVGIFVTCNGLPNYGGHEETLDVHCRLETMKTIRLMDKSSEAPEWMREHAMEVLFWIVSELYNYKRLIDKEELFFQRDVNDFVKPKVRCTPALTHQHAKFNYRTSLLNIHAITY